MNQIPSDKPMTYYASDLFLSCATFKVPTEVLLKLQVFWDVMPCHLLNSYQHLQGL